MITKKKGENQDNGEMTFSEKWISTKNFKRRKRRMRIT